MSSMTVRDEYEDFDDEFLDSVNTGVSNAKSFFQGVASPMVGCVIPAYNEEESIASVLQGLLDQTLMPDVIHLVVNNTTDKTVEVARKFAGAHTKVDAEGFEQFTEIFIHDIGTNPDKKVGALNYGYELLQGYDYLIGVDGDTVAENNAIEWLVKEIASDPRIGGISAIYSIDDQNEKGFIAPFLIAGQRAQFAAFNMQNMLKGRNMAVLGGQFSIFNMEALAQTVEANHQRNPWVKDSEVEDSLLSLQIKSAGFLTKISARSYAWVGGMPTLRSLDAQQVKWNYGAIELMWPGQRGDTKGQPFHPNLRLRWFEHLSMLINIVSRIMFIILLIGSLSINAFVFEPVWLIPPIMATLLNLRVAFSMKNRTWKDILFAGLFFPAEMYMWVRMGHFLRAWSKFFSRKKVDNWAAQAQAEKGKGFSYLAPAVTVMLIFIATAFIWLQLPIVIQASILWFGWPALGFIVTLQTLNMVRKIIQRHQGYKV